MARHSQARSTENRPVQFDQLGLILRVDLPRRTSTLRQCDTLDLAGEAILRMSAGRLCIFTGQS